VHSKIQLSCRSWPWGRLPRIALGRHVYWKLIGDAERHTSELVPSVPLTALFDSPRDQQNPVVRLVSVYTRIISPTRFSKAESYVPVGGWNFQNSGGGLHDR
jgi:hypothetical protein